jgi:hypothetical protein
VDAVLSIYQFKNLTYFDSLSSAPHKLLNRIQEYILRELGVRLQQRISGLRNFFLSLRIGGSRRVVHVML